MDESIMTQQDKDLLLRDLSARLPYGVILQVGIFDNGDIKYHNKKLDYHSKLLSLIELDGGYYLNGLLCKYPQFTAKPQLRPMSGMTEGEKKEAHRLFSVLYDRNNVICGIQINSFAQLDKAIEWLNKRHFDWRGLIPKGLALEAKEEMYNLK